MRSHLEFRSRALCDELVDQTVPGGEAVAMLLVAELPRHGYKVDRVYPEDWGWCVSIANAAFPLWIGCGRYHEYPDGHLCFLEPSQPFIRRWLKRVSTSQIVERLAITVEGVIRAHSDTSDLRWWTETEVSRG